MTRYISIEVDDMLYNAVERHARSKGLRVATWCRVVIMEALPKSKPVAKQSRQDIKREQLRQWLMMPLSEVEGDPDFILLPRAKKRAIREAINANP